MRDVKVYKENQEVGYLQAETVHTMVYGERQSFKVLGKVLFRKAGAVAVRSGDAGLDAGVWGWEV